MASPQKENGYTPIANELLEALAKIRLSGEETQVLLVLIRKTYGFQKKVDTIALSQFVEATGINKPNVCRAIAKLISKNIIIKKDNPNITSYSIQKNYARWKPLSKKIMLSKKIIGVIKKDNSPLSKKIHTKETLTKETLTKYNNAFEQFKQSYPPEAWEDTKYCKMKFMALCKKGKLDEFRKGCESYGNFMAMEHTQGFKGRRWKSSKTFINNWEEWAEKKVQYIEPL